MSTKLRRIINPQERIYWESKPNLKCLILESIFNPLLPFALVWAAIDFGFIGSILLSSQDATEKPPLFFIIPFFALHLMPVWIYLFGVLGCLFRYANTAYVITNKNVYISKGTFSYSYKIIPINQIGDIEVHQGVFDRIIGVGDIELTRDFSQHLNEELDFDPKQLPMSDLIDYKKIYQKHRRQTIYHKQTKSNDLIISNIADFINVNQLLQRLKNQSVEHSTQFDYTNNYF